MKSIHNIAAVFCIIVTLMPGSGLPAPAQTGTPQRLVIAAVSPYLSPENAVVCLSNLLEYATTPAESKPGDIIWAFDGLGLKPIVKLEVPSDLPQDNQIARIRRMAGGLAALKAWILGDRPHAPEWADAIDAPGLLALAGSQVRSSPREPVAVLMFGGPFYVGPAGLVSAFAMSDGYVPSDGTLTAVPGETPFVVASGDALLGITVYWAYLNERFAHEQNRFACGRFWTLLCQQGGARLSSWTASPSIALARLHAGVTESALSVKLDEADAKVVAMRKVIMQRAPASQDTNSVEFDSLRPRSSTATKEATKTERSSNSNLRATSHVSDIGKVSAPHETNRSVNLLPEPACLLPQTPKGKLGIGCVWVSPGSPHPEEADIDLYVTTPEGEVLCYKNLEAKSGRYFRDVRSSGSGLEANDAWRTSWEYVELREMTDSELCKVRCSANVFRGSGGSIRGLLQVVCGERKAVQSFTFDTPKGNGGADREKRPSQFWVDFDLAALMSNSTTNQQ